MPAPQGGRSGVSQPLHGFFVVLMTAMIAGAWLYFDATVRELRGQINQVQAEVRGVKAMQKTEKTAMAEVKPADDKTWKRFQSGNYAFDVPPEWRADFNGGFNALFFDEDGRTIAAFSCPLPETGYEAWKFDRSERSFKDPAGRDYLVKLWLGTPDTEAYREDVVSLGDLQLMTIARENDERNETGCLLQSSDAPPGTAEVFRRIYSTVGPRS